MWGEGWQLWSTDDKEGIYHDKEDDGVDEDLEKGTEAITSAIKGPRRI